MTEYGLVYADDYGAIGTDPLSTQVDPWPTPSNLPDSGAVLQAAINAVPLGGKLKFRHCRYYSGRKLTIPWEMTIEGAFANQAALCGIIFNYGIPGIEAQQPLTLRGIALMAKARPAGSGVRNPAAHGVIALRRIFAQEVEVRYFEGDGIHIEGHVSAGTNANQWCY